MNEDWFPGVLDRVVFLDTETTGLDPESGDRIVCLACVEMLDAKFTGRTFHRFVNPQCKQSAEAIEIHGLPDEFLSDEPTFGDVADEFLDFVRGAEIVAHNADFDTRFINAELSRLDRPPLSSYVPCIVDTLELARDQFPGQSNSLDALCSRFGIVQQGGASDVLADAHLVGEVVGSPGTELEFAL